jgi:ABC-2 type transport system permease protein
MTGSAGTVAHTPRAPGRTRISPRARVWGLGSVFGKSFRDSRRGILLAGLMGGLFMAAAAAAMLEFDTPEARLELLASIELLPVVMRGLLGEPIAIDTLGGFLSWRIGNILPVFLGIWSVLALSGTLAGEAARGSLELVAASPTSRRRLALQKLGAHVVAVVIALLLASLLTWLTTIAFAVVPGDEVAMTSVLAHYALTGVLMLAAGSVAFAAAPLLGQGRAAGLGFAILFGMFLVNSYAALSPAIEAAQPMSWFAWTADHRPMAGQTDWLAVLLTGGLAALLLAVGVVGFERRDLGAVSDARWLRLPSLPAGTGGPFRRQLADRTGIALAWGTGVALYGAMIAASAEAFAEGLGQIPMMEQMLGMLYPGVDFREPSGILTLAFFGFGSLMVGFAAATIVAGWSSDEGNRRLDMVLSTPLSRARWALATGLGVYAAIVLAAAVIGIVIAIATVAQGFDPAGPIGGTVVLALYGMAFAGLGLAVGGLRRPELAPGVTGGLVVASFLLDLLGPALNVPDPVVDLSLNRHLGQPMAGIFEPVGIVAGLVLAAGGLAVMAWGYSRRDIGR